MGLPVPQGDPQVDERVSGGDAAGGLRADALLDGRDELAWYRSADDLVDELDAGPRWQRLDVDLADGVLTVAAGLFDVPAASGGRPRERLAQGDAVGDGVDLDRVPAAQPVERHVQMGLPEAPQDHLVGVLVLLQAHGGVLGHEPREALGELVLVRLAVRLDGERQQRVGHGPRLHQQRMVRVGQGVAGLGGAQPGDAGEIPGDALGDGALLFAER